VTRRLRIVWEIEAEKPWIVQTDSPLSQQWSDALRFETYMKAVDYVGRIEKIDGELSGGSSR
jgi:hypothetical protein